jgi:hypothetical protein
VIDSRKDRLPSSVPEIAKVDAPATRQQHRRDEMKTATAVKKEIGDIKPTDVYVAYSGPNGVCSCGCAGDWKYNPNHRALAETEHQALLKRFPGALAPKFSLRYITHVLKMLQENADGVVNYRGTFFVGDVDDKMYKIETVAGVKRFAKAAA